MTVRDFVTCHSTFLETVPLYRLPAAYKHCGPVCLSVLSNLSMAFGLPNAKTAVVSTIELRYPRSTGTVSRRQGTRFCMIQILSKDRDYTHVIHVKVGSEIQLGYAILQTGRPSGCLDAAK
jgi:hypothetical protein